MYTLQTKRRYVTTGKILLHQKGHFFAENSRKNRFIYAFQVGLMEPRIFYNGTQLPSILCCDDAD